jgi:uroporphyrinogen decarboxylase
LPERFFVKVSIKSTQLAGERRIMNSKQRVHAALRRQPVDRIPIFMWFHPQTKAILAKALEIPQGQVDLVMGNDVRMTWVNNNAAMEGVVHEHDGEGHVDEWGIHWVKEGPYNQIAHFPLANASLDEVRAYRFPVAAQEALLARMQPLLAGGDEFFIGCDVSPCVFEMYWRLRGLGETAMEMAGEPELTYEMFGRCADFAVQLSEAACRRFPLDWLWTGDDVASQRSLLMSPQRWRTMIKPHLARVFAVGKAHGLWLAYHCCGALRPIIADLVEMGLDVLNPIQCNCPGMDPLELKREFGAALSFMGGVDTQELLPHGTVAEVQRATRRLIDGMTGDGGGYILAASHTIPLETPLENIFAMYAEAGLGREAIFDRAAAARAAGR